MPPRDPTERIYRVIMRIPRGRVATYGQVATIAGIPRGHRLVGRALRGLIDDGLVPWHRVVNAGGTISTRSLDGSIEVEQRERLQAEGVEFDARGRIRLPTCQWRQGLPRRPG